MSFNVSRPSRLEIYLFNTSQAFKILFFSWNYLALYISTVLYICKQVTYSSKMCGFFFQVDIFALGLLCFGIFFHEFLSNSSFQYSLGITLTVMLQAFKSSSFNLSGYNRVWINYTLKFLMNIPVCLLIFEMFQLPFLQNLETNEIPNTS